MLDKYVKIVYNEMRCESAAKWARKGFDGDFEAG